MYKHILLPVDGSLTGIPATRACLAFAREAGAKVSAVHVLADGDQGHARRILQAVEAEASGCGVPCAVNVLHGAEPYRAIIDFASEHGCDLICMASHGRRGAAALVLASETQKVLTHGALPVLVLR